MKKTNKKSTALCFAPENAPNWQWKQEHQGQQEYSIHWSGQQPLADSPVLPEQVINKKTQISTDVQKLDNSRCESEIAAKDPSPLGADACRARLQHVHRRSSNCKWQADELIKL